MNSLSLALGYGSSESSSESEPDVPRPAPTKESTSRQQAQPSRALGAKLADILPPPRSTSQLAGNNKIKITVDLPTASTTTAAEYDWRKDKPKLPETQSNKHSDLASILPAPRGSASHTAQKPQQQQQENNSTGSHAQQRSPETHTRVLVPHSVASRKRASGDPGAGKLTKRRTGSPNVEGSEKQADHTTTVPKTSSAGPFFTLTEPALSSASHGDDALPAQDSSGKARDSDTSGPLQSQQDASHLVYDASSGYYYDYVSGRYLYYNTASGTYIDVAELYPEMHQQDEDNNQLPLTSAIDATSLEALIGRGAFRRGEASGIATGAVREVSQKAQLADTEGFDARAAQAAADASSRVHVSQTAATGMDQVSKKQKQKHNIMYLAMQSQEQGAQVKAAQAKNRQAKKDRQMRYGF